MGFVNNFVYIHIVFVFCLGMVGRSCYYVYNEIFPFCWFFAMIFHVFSFYIFCMFIVILDVYC